MLYIQNRKLATELTKLIYILDEFQEDLDRCKTAFNFIKFYLQESICNKFKPPYKWLLIYKRRVSIKYIPNMFSKMNLRLDTSLMIAVTDKTKSYQIFEIYKHGSCGDIKIKSIGYFTNETIFYHSNLTSFYEARKNLKGIIIRTGSMHNYSYETEDDIANAMRSRSQSQFEKFNFQIFLALKQLHKFSYNTTIRSAYYGNSSSGIDSGIGKLLHEKRVDISTPGGLLRMDRVNYYDFLVPVYKFRTCFVLINPGTVKPGMEILKPFARKTWYVYVLTGAILALSINLSYWITNKYLKYESDHNLFASLTTTVSVFTQQGADTVPFKICGRIILLSMLLMSLLVHNYYTSSLVSSLLSSMPQKLNTIQELYESKLNVAIDPRPYTITYILQQKDDYYISQLNRTKIYVNDVPNFLTPMEGIEKVKQGNYAYLTDDVISYSLLADESQEVLCNLNEINFMPNGVIGVVMQKHSEYSKLFSISLRKMQSSGIYTREAAFWISKKPACLLSSIIKAVDVNELFLVYLILLSGIILAIVILILELRIYKYKFVLAYIK